MPLTGNREKPRPRVDGSEAVIVQQVAPRRREQRRRPAGRPWNEGAARAPRAGGCAGARRCARGAVSSRGDGEGRDRLLDEDAR